MHFNSFFLFLTSGKTAVTDFKAPSITWVFGSFSLPWILSPKLQRTLQQDTLVLALPEPFKAKNTFSETKVLSSVSILINRGTRCNEHGKCKTGFYKALNNSKTSEFIGYINLCAKAEVFKPSKIKKNGTKHVTKQCLPLVCIYTPIFFCSIPLSSICKQKS